MPYCFLEICNDFLNVRGLLGPEKQARDQSPAAKRVGSALELSTSGKMCPLGDLSVVLFVFWFVFSFPLDAL